jgi:hypothetical protein
VLLIVKNILLWSRGTLHAARQTSFCSCAQAKHGVLQVAVNDLICIGRPDNDIGRLISASANELVLDILPTEIYQEVLTSVDPTEVFQLMA